jgi:hypothetical protein
MNLNKYTLLLLVSLFTLSLNAQYIYPDKDKCEELKTRTLIVKIFDEKKQADITINEAIADVFKNNWTLCPVIFKTNKEIKKMVKGLESQYAILAFGEEGKANVDFDPAIEPDYSQFDFTKTLMSLYYLKEGEKEFDLVNITTIATANKNLVKSDYLFVVQQLNLLINSALQGIQAKDYFNIDREKASLISKTLLIPDELVKDNEKEKIINFYKDKFQRIKTRELEQIIVEKANDKAYVKIIWSEQHNSFVWVAVNAQDGKILGLISLAPAKFTTPFPANNILKIKTLANLIKPEVQKKNNKYL